LRFIGSTIYQTINHHKRKDKLFDISLWYKKYKFKKTKGLEKAFFHVGYNKKALHWALIIQKRF
jgi:hypothetical protein